jgi:hypothetical protein
MPGPFSWKWLEGNEEVVESEGMGLMWMRKVSIRMNGWRKWKRAEKQQSVNIQLAGPREKNSSARTTNMGQYYRPEFGFKRKLYTSSGLESFTKLIAQWKTRFRSSLNDHFTLLNNHSTRSWKMWIHSILSHCFTSIPRKGCIVQQSISSCIAK